MGRRGVPLGMKRWYAAGLLVIAACSSATAPLEVAAPVTAAAPTSSPAHAVAPCAPELSYGDLIIAGRLHVSFENDGDPLCLYRETRAIPAKHRSFPGWCAPAGIVVPARPGPIRPGDPLQFANFPFFNELPADQPIGGTIRQDGARFIAVLQTFGAITAVQIKGDTGAAATLTPVGGFALGTLSPESAKSTRFTISAQRGAETLTFEVPANTTLRITPAGPLREECHNALPAFEPPGADASRSALSTAFATLFDRQIDSSAATQVLDTNERATAAINGLRGRYGGVAGGSMVKLRQIAFESSESAVVRAELSIWGPHSLFDLRAIRRGGEWKFTEDSYCALLGSLTPLPTC